MILHWSKYRGPGDVTFDKLPPVFEKMDGPAVFNGKATVNAKFSAPGEYILHVHGGRLFGRRRRRRSLLLDDGDGEGGRDA